VDAFGNLFIADTYNSAIRKVDTNGIITTVAGDGNSGYSGDGGAATNASLYWPAGVTVDVLGNLYISDTYDFVIRKVDTNGLITTVAGGGANNPGDGGAATNASLSYLQGVTTDAAGNLIFVDSGNDRIRKVVLSASSSTTDQSNKLCWECSHVHCRCGGDTALELSMGF